jgi:hypothetical protein
MSALKTKPDVRIVAIGELLAKAGHSMTQEAVDLALKQNRVTEAEIAAATQLLAPAAPRPSALPVPGLPLVAPVDSRLAPKLVPIGAEIGRAIAAIVGVAVTFLPAQSITSYQIHLFRFQPVAQGNFGRIESPEAIKVLRGAVSLPYGTSCEVRPSDEIGKPGYIDVKVPRADRQYILFSAQEVGGRNLGGQPPATIVGKDLYGKNVELSGFVHRAIVGESGSGKSTFIHQDVAIQSYWNDPRYLKFAFVDLERRTFARFQNYAWNFCAPLLDPDQDKWDDFWRPIMDLFSARSEQFEDCEDVLAWNRQNPDRPEPIVNVMIEELGQLNAAFGRERVDETLIKFAETGRAKGIYLTLAMQRPAADSANGVIHPRVMNNIQTRIAFQCKRQTAGLVDCPAAVNLRGNGDGLLLRDGDWVPFQAFHMGDYKSQIFSGMDVWGRRRYGDRNCYHAPKPEPKKTPDPWEPDRPKTEPVPEMSDRQKYDRYLKIKHKKPTEIIRDLFPDSRSERHLSGNTLAKYQRQLDDLIAQFEK